MLLLNVSNIIIRHVQVLNFLDQIEKKILISIHVSIFQSQTLTIYLTTVALHSSTQTILSITVTIVGNATTVQLVNRIWFFHSLYLSVSVHVRLHSSDHLISAITFLTWEVHTPTCDYSHLVTK